MDKAIGRNTKQKVVEMELLRPKKFEKKNKTMKQIQYL